MHPCCIYYCNRSLEFSQETSDHFLKKLTGDPSGKQQFTANQSIYQLFDKYRSVPDAIDL